MSLLSPIVEICRWLAARGPYLSLPHYCVNKQCKDSVYAASSVSLETIFETSKSLVSYPDVHDSHPITAVDYTSGAVEPRHPPSPLTPNHHGHTSFTKLPNARFIF